MAITVKSINELQKYFKGVVKRSGHHAPNVTKVIYPLLGHVILKLDDDSDIQVRSYSDAPGNILWIHINGIRYAFKYEHSDDTIKICKNNYKGEIVSKINNSTTDDELIELFNRL